MNPPTPFVPPPLVFVPPPTHEQLTARAGYLEVKLGEADYAHRWFCHKCTLENHPSKNLLINLHPFGCSRCGEQNPTSFVWSMIESVANEVELDFVIRNQGDHQTCTAHALIAGMDMKRRIYGALFGLWFSQELDIRDLLKKFFGRFSEVLGKEKTLALMFYRIHCLMSIAQIEGVNYETASAMVPDVYPMASLGRVLKIASCFLVQKTMVDHIVRLLAGGFPLVTAVPVGRCFRYVAAGQIYNASKIPPNHAVLLIGFGTATWPGDAFAPQNSALAANWPVHPTTGQKRLRTFYRARGSAGDLQHPDHQLDGLGGDFDIWAEDIDETLWGFYLTEEDIH